MPSLLVFIENHSSGGGTKYALSLVEALSDSFSSITVLTNPQGLTRKETARFQSVEFIEFRFLTLHGFKMKIMYQLDTHILVRRMLSLLLKSFELPIFIGNIILFFLKLRKFRPDSVLVANGGFPASHASQAMLVSTRLLRIPNVLSVVSMPSQRDKRFIVIERIYDYIIRKSTNSLVTNSQAIIDELKSIRNIFNNRCHVIYNGIDELSDLNLLHSVEISKSDIVVACVGRVEASKGSKLILRVFEKIAPEFPKAKLVYVGSGQLEEKLRKETIDRGLGNQVSFLGEYDQDIAFVLKNVDVLVIPSYWEGLPYVLIEGFRSGNTIISSKVGGIPDVVKDGEDALLFDVGSEDDLESKLRKVLADQKLRIQLSKAGRRKFLSQFEVGVTHKDLYKVFLPAQADD